MELIEDIERSAKSSCFTCIQVFSTFYPLDTNYKLQSIWRSLKFNSIVQFMILIMKKLQKGDLANSSYP